MLASERAATVPGREIDRPTVRPFEPLDYVTLHSLCARQQGRPLVPDPWAVGEAYQKAGPAFTVEGVICGTTHSVIASAGLVLQWPGRATSWAILTPDLRSDVRLALWLVLTIKRGLKALIAHHGLRRVEADVVCGNGDGVRLVRALGFGPPEGISRKYGLAGEDCLRYAMIVEGA